MRAYPKLLCTIRSWVAVPHDYSDTPPPSIPTIAFASGFGKLLISYILAMMCLMTIKFNVMLEVAIHYELGTIIIYYDLGRNYWIQKVRG